ncbi:MAG: ABC transporter substrate-binding protein [Pseudomonadota bacterium]
MINNSGMVIRRHRLARKQAIHWLVVLAVVVLGLDRTAFAQTESLRVVTEDLAPYNYRHDGALKGIGTDVVRAVLARLDRAPKIEVLSWARAYRLALKRPNVLIFSISRTAQREDLFHWIGLVADLRVSLYRRNDRNDIVLKNLQSAKVHLVATVRDSAGEQFLLANGFTPGRNIDNSGDPLQSISKVIKGRVPLLIADDLWVQWGVEHLALERGSLTPALHLPESSRPLFMALSRGSDAKLIGAFRQAHQAVIESGEFIKILRRYSDGGESERGASK